MINRIELSQADKDLMAQYNIKAETRTLFYSEGYKYDNLKDALSYAKLSIERKRASGDN
jgi:hypothetical protein